MFSRPKIVYLAIKSCLLHVTQVVCYMWFVDFIALREVCGRYFVFAILQITLRSLKFRLALVTPENTQVSIYGTLRPEICLTRASVT